MERCSSVVVVVRRFGALIPRSFGDAYFFSFVFSNYINCRIGDSLALYLCFFDDQQIRLWSGHVCSRFLSDGCQIWECLFPPSINVPTLFGLSFQWSLEFVDANRVLQSEL